MIDKHNLTAKRPIIVVGAAFGDVMLSLNQLPISGGDVEAEALARQIGGCAFNVAKALSRMDIPFINAISIGNGSWGKLIESTMLRENIAPLLYHPTHDNGWCIAMVEENKERTFITVNGCEQHWTDALLNQIPMPGNALVYVSGYELVSPQSESLRQWILNLPSDYTLCVDFGPRLADIDPDFIQKLLDKQPILTVNRDELAILTKQDTSNVAAAVIFANQHNLSLICRFDADGAQVCQPNQSPLVVPAFQVEVTDTIAAGDSHCAGILAGLAAGWSLERATTLGNMVAAIVVGRSGSNGAPSLEELIQFQATHI